MGFKELTRSGSENNGGSDIRVVADTPLHNNNMPSGSLVKPHVLHSSSISSSTLNSSAFSLSARKMKGYGDMALVESFGYESCSGSDNFESASRDVHDVGNDPPSRRKKYHRHTPHQIQELEVYGFIQELFCSLFWFL